MCGVRVGEIAAAAATAATDGDVDGGLKRIQLTVRETIPLDVMLNRMTRLR
jgi:hypothetical protein